MLVTEGTGLEFCVSGGVVSRDFEGVKGCLSRRHLAAKEGRLGSFFILVRLGRFSGAGKGRLFLPAANFNVKGVSSRSQKPRRKYRFKD